MCVLIIVMLKTGIDMDMLAAGIFFLDQYMDL